VNEVTGEPVPRATVAALSVENGDTIESVTTGSDGRFALERLPAAKYQLTASKRGYKTGLYDQHEDFNSAIVTGAGQETENLTFRLTPSAQLDVTVTDDNGDPVGNARIMVFRRIHDLGLGGRAMRIQEVTTDDTGTHEFSSLDEGEYFVAVKADPWYAMHNAPASASAPSQPERVANSALDVAYPLTFFDGATDEAAATPIILAAGSREEIAINLHAVPALHLLVKVPGGQNGQAAAPELRQSIFGTEISQESTRGASQAKPGTVEFSGVAPGHYELEQGDPPRIVDLDASASQQIDANSGAPAVSVQGTLRSASGAALPDGVTVILGCTDWTHPKAPIQTASSGGSFSFPAVPPGAWGLWAEAPGRTLSVLSTTQGGTKYAGSLVTVGDRPMRMTVTVSEGDTRVEGVVRKDGKGVAGVMVVLVPRDPVAMLYQFRRDQTDSDGSFSLREVAPGSYTVVAIEDGWKLEWARPEVIDRYLAGGVAVTVTNQSAKRLQLSVPVAVQTR
jgi:hypothetical protein